MSKAETIQQIKNLLPLKEKEESLIEITKDRPKQNPKLYIPSDIKQLKQEYMKMGMEFEDLREPQKFRSIKLPAKILGVVAFLWLLTSLPSSGKMVLYFAPFAIALLFVFIYIDKVDHKREMDHQEKVRRTKSKHKAKVMNTLKKEKQKAFQALEAQNQQELKQRKDQYVPEIFAIREQYADFSLPADKYSYNQLTIIKDHLESDRAEDFKEAAQLVWYDEKEAQKQQAYKQELQKHQQKMKKEMDFLQAEHEEEMSVMKNKMNNDARKNERQLEDLNRDLNNLDDKLYRKHNSSIL
ncbi:hypothetical protein IMZ31_16795 [Pontibacillus sp. ALD_SL1]|uniref:hypothetical protein n=1 Tax=Pontibacillus sp. ALD_SL1 TaxID=2777185 RepID=UPI001A96021C|nr:hypothetical protein [Pontibacillus sp. ALD_SL1]QSS99700.1 hypothetical protein IMZ31_16795 [Pontibacillus sp. ALD_SL1]